jgi:hypothetical protein
MIGNGSSCASPEIVRSINYPLAVMFDGQYLDAGGGHPVNDPVGSLKQLSHFVVYEGLQSRPAARSRIRSTMASARGLESWAM